MKIFVGYAGHHTASHYTPSSSTHQVIKKVTVEGTVNSNKFKKIFSYEDYPSYNIMKIKLKLTNLSANDSYLQVKTGGDVIDTIILKPNTSNAVFIFDNCIEISLYLKNKVQYRVDVLLI